MTHKPPATIRFPAVTGDTPTSWQRPPARAEDLVTERAIAVPRHAVRDRAHLTLLTGPSAGEVYTLMPGETIIGRDEEAHVRPDDTAISRRHARILRDASGDYIVEDLSSTNGTYVASERVTRHVLRSGEQVQFGPNMLYRFAMTDEAEERLQRQLFESSIRDSLTQAYNRKYLNERLAAEVAHAHRHHTKLAVLMLDLDEFKATNDRHGHLAGDAVLHRVAEAIHALIRIEDVFARFGGEEFVVVTRGDGVHNATQLAERLRRRIADLIVMSEGIVLAVTVSIGVAELDELGAEARAVDLLERADGRLYRAKALGRNQVCSNDP